MKLKYIFGTLVASLLALALPACDEQKELVIIDGNLPIKTKTLYMVGSATPNGWSIDDPTPLTATEDDVLVFEWEGDLRPGEIKLCLTPGSWNAAFIRPKVDGEEISSTANIENQTFTMHAGDPDRKWKVTEAGRYRLHFDLRNWTMSATYMGAPAPVVKDPIVADAVYLVGTAINGWDMEKTAKAVKESDYIFVYEGELRPGEFKAALMEGTWDQPFIRPETADVTITKDSISSHEFAFCTNPDDKWNVIDHAVYRVTFDLQNWKINTEFVSAIVEEQKPIAAPVVYLFGEATPGKWDLDLAEELIPTAANKYVYKWTGTLTKGDFKMSLEKAFDGIKFLRPETDGSVLNSKGFASNKVIFTYGPDNKWKVTEGGTYAITLDLENYTISAVYNGAAEDPVIPQPDVKTPIVAEELYMIGTATQGQWSFDAAEKFTKSSSDPYVFTWTGELAAGSIKMSPVKNYDAKFIRPASADVPVSSAGVAMPDFVYTASPDNMWKVTEAGVYTITLNLEKYTIAVVYKGAPEYPEPAIPGGLDTKTLYMIGSATAGGWSWDNVTPLTKMEGKRYIFVWEGELSAGEMKASAVIDPSWGGKFVRPTVNTVIGTAGLKACKIQNTAGDPDNKWTVSKAGRYRLTFDLGNWTLDADYLPAPAQARKKKR